MDLHLGATPSVKHSLAAIFIGCSIGFGHHTIAWALLQPAAVWTIVLIVDGLIACSYSLDRQRANKQRA